MRTLLVGLDNHNRLPSDQALHPEPEHLTGGRIVRLIQEVIPDYTAGRFLLDFRRTNLYPFGPAIGAKKHDRWMAAHVLQLCDVCTVNDIVLFGRRTTNAFDAIIKPPEYFESTVIERGAGVIRFWSLPHPSGRNYLYNRKANRKRAGKVLANLRARQEEAA